jgi:hypothetical protein
MLEPVRRERRNTATRIAAKRGEAAGAIEKALN